jgi:hypothetical protein
LLRGTRSLGALAVLLPALALAGTITTGPTPEEQAQAEKREADARAKQKAPPKKPPAKKAAPPPPATKTSPSASARDNFRKANPCPSTGRSTGSCPGYEVEHMNPPACGGADSPGNMQWVASSAVRKKGAECKTR